MRKALRLALSMLLCILVLTACAGKAPEKHELAPPEDYPTTRDDDGADAYAGALDHTDTAYYVIHDFYNSKSGGSLHILSHFETYQQTTEYTCGVAAAQMVLHRYGVDDYDEMQLADMVQTDPETGTTVEGLRDLFLSLGWHVDSHAGTDLRFSAVEDWVPYLLEQIDAGIPVMVDWADWAGHWQVVIGVDTCATENHDDDVLILADPYDVTDHYQDGYYIYPLSRFFDMWWEGPIAQKTEPYQQPFVTAFPQN